MRRMERLYTKTFVIRLIIITQINHVMIQVKEVTDKFKDDYEGRINCAIREQTEAGWKLIDIKHSVANNGSSGIISSALLIFDDSPTADMPTSLNQ